MSINLLLSSDQFIITTLVSTRIHDSHVVPQQQENDAKDVVQIVIECIQILAKYNCDLDVCDSTGDSILIHA